MNFIALEDPKVSTRIKLSSLWASLMFLYIYADYFELYVPGKLPEMLAGKMALGAVTRGMLLGTSVLMAVPSLMIFLSLALPSSISRWLNIAAGLFYAGIVILVLIGGGWSFYLLYAAIEIVLSLLIVWYAWSWPKQGASPA